MKKFYGQNVVDKMVNFYDSLSESAPQAQRGVKRI